MGRDETDAFITVPSLFKCPISLDLMRSPVSLCTGVTYDRPSIQRWLDGGNNTCPATMQILPTKDFVPNLTLQRLIQSWSHSPPTIEQLNDSLQRLILDKDDEMRPKILSTIVRFVQDSDKNRELLARKNGVVPMLVDIIRLTTQKMETVVQALKILDTIKGDFDREKLSNLMLITNGGDCLKAILIALQKGNLETKMESVRVLDWISFDAKSKFVIAEHYRILSEIISWVNTASDPSLIETSLSFLITISKSKRVRSTLISAETVTKISGILLTEETMAVAVIEKALKLLETLSSKRQGRREICNGGCVEGVVKKLLKVSTTATEHAVTILWCLCHVFREREDKTVEEVVERCNGVTKLLVVIQSNCSGMVRQMAKDLIKVFNIHSSASSLLSAYETNTTHITPF